MLLRDAVFGDASKIDADNDAINESLSRNVDAGGAVPSSTWGPSDRSPDSGEASRGHARMTPRVPAAGGTASSHWKLRRAADGLRLCAARRWSSWPSSSSLPLLLVGQDVAEQTGRCCTGDRGVNFPEQLRFDRRRTSCSGRRWCFTLKYTVLVTVLLLGLGLGLALLVQTSGRWVGHAPHRASCSPVSLGLASASLLFYGFYSPAIGPINPSSQQLGLIERADHLPRAPRFTPCCRRPSSSSGSTPASTCSSCSSASRRIPDDVYEAAALDGASRWQTLPPRHAAAAAAVAGAGADPVRHRFAARLRPVLHPHQGRAGQLARSRSSSSSTARRSSARTSARPPRSRSSCWSCCSCSTPCSSAALRRIEAETDAMAAMTIRRLLGRTPYYVLTGGLAIIFLFPLVWSVVASVSPQAGDRPAHRLRPRQLHDALRLRRRAADGYVLNSVDRLGPDGRASRSRCRLLGGYAFARFTFPGKNVLFLVTLAILMVPYATLLIPLYVLLEHARPAQLAGRPGAGARHVPAAVRDVHDAHLVRGGATRARGIRAGRRLRHVRRPAAHPAARGRSGPHHGRPVRLPGGLERLLRAADPASATRAKQTLPLAVANLRQQTMGAIDYGATEAGVVVMALPCLVLFLLLQRYYVRGFMSGAVKG